MIQCSLNEALLSNHVCFPTNVVVPILAVPGPRWTQPRQRAEVLRYPRSSIVALYVINHEGQREITH